MNDFVDPGYTFQLSARLTDDQYERLMDIPGCQPWHPYGKRIHVKCAVSAAACVSAAINSAGLVVSNEYMTVPDPIDRNVTLDHVKARTCERGVYAWVWTAFLATFQGDGILDIARRKFNAHLWAEPGAGKTVMACVSAAASDATRIVVVTLPGLIRQTAEEWRRFLNWEIMEYRPPSRRRVTDVVITDFTRARTGAPSVIVIGWDHLVHEEEALSAFLRGGRALIVWDESQEGKNPKRKKFIMGENGKLTATDLKTQSATAGRLARLAQYRIATTATSLDNALTDLWGQLTLVEPDAWGSTGTRFQKRYCGATTNEYGGLDVGGMDRTHLDELNARLVWTVVRIPYEVSHGQLPAKRRQVIRVPVEEQVKELTAYGREIRQADKEAAAGDMRAKMRSVQLRTQQAASRKRNAIVHGVTPYFSVGKGKIIVFSGVKKDCEHLAERFGKEGVTVFCSHGDDSIDERNVVRDAYMAHPGPCVLVGTWHAWGTGFNLDDTDCITFAMLPNKPKEIAQGEGRADRLSMTRPVMYLYFVAEGTVDERIVDIILNKL